MNIDYIIVQAGGKGTRMEYLTKNKPKALVPINNLPMLFHLFRKFPDKKFLIIADYKIDVMQKYLDAFSPVQHIVIDAKGKNGTCAGIKQAINMIPNNEAFMMIWSDLVLPESFIFPDETDNFIGLSKTFPCRWKYENDRFEEETSLEFGVAGLFIFKNKLSICDVPEEGEFVRWLSTRNNNFKTIGLYSTKEYGLISEWKKIKNNDTGSRCRPFNSMKVLDNVIIKEGIDDQGHALSVREKAWYRYVQQKGYHQIPKIYEFNPLTMEKINGHNIFEYRLTKEEKKVVLDRIINTLSSLHAIESVPTDYFSIYDAYVQKTLKRLDTIRNLIPFADQQYIRINGKNCRNIYYYREEFKKLFSNYTCGEFKLIHGDNTFSNLMLNENLEPVLIDPRGYFGHTELFGDIAYDWAKLYYSIVGNYDQFNLKRFKLEINPNEVSLNIESNGWEDMESYFLEKVKYEISENQIKLIHAVIWLSLTTYAWEDYDSICGAFYNGLYYLEDVL